FYVRPGVGTDANRWVIHLQGGSACRDYESCLARWCGQQGALPYTANKMSSDWDGDGVTDLAAHVTGPGMASSNPANAFSTWTHVWAYYCSSDAWQGRASDVTFTDGVNSFDLDARGHTILYAMRRMLRKNNPNSTWQAEGGYSVADLDAATDIVFTGTSAGAKGAITNADWFLSVFPSADRSLVLDANYDVSDAVLWNNDVWIDEDNDGVGDAEYYAARIQILNDDWHPGGYSHAIDAFTDTTCRDWYEPLDAMDLCSQFSTLLEFSIGGAPVIETPTFVRFDLSDPVISDEFTDHPNKGGFGLLIGGPNGTPTTLQDFRVMMRASLLEAYIDHDAVSGVIAPRCGQHVGLEDSQTFGFKLTPDTDETFTPPALVVGTDTTVHDAIWDWLNVGGGGSRIDIRRLDTDQVGVRFSTCN
ncbi:MAG: pectin acetylesterase-family hydrolase, partial [Polyangiaceae bacterium]